jgi:hypothetical protein
MDMEPIPDMEDIPVEAAAEVALDEAMSMEDDDMCDISMLKGEGLLKDRCRMGGTTRAFQQVD